MPRRRHLSAPLHSMVEQFILVGRQPHLRILSRRLDDSEESNSEVASLMRPAGQYGVPTVTEILANVEKKLIICEVVWTSCVFKAEKICEIELELHFYKTVNIISFSLSLRACLRLHLHDLYYGKSSRPNNVA